MNELILLKDLGRKYPTIKSTYKKRMGLYKCFCGKEFEAHFASVKRGLTKSCGCSKITHGLKKHRLYDTYNNMIKRCFHTHNPSYKNYGGRGITVCNEWLDIQNFINDMYPSFEEGLTLDRIDVNGNYCKDNCRWVTDLIQAQNKRKLISTNTVGYKGVYLRKTNKYSVKICVNYKQIHLGYYETALEGALAYDKYIIENNLEHTKNFTD